MTPEQLVELAAGGESETLEFKKTTAELDTAARAVCAMLNHRGGRVLFGVAENPTRVVGQEVGAQTVERVAQRLREIDPPTLPAIERVPVGQGREVIVVTVSPGPTAPYTLKSKGTGESAIRTKH